MTSKQQAKTEKADQFLGMPMRWEADKLLKNFWNKQDQRVFPPKYFGVGWDINFYALSKKIGIVKEDKPVKN